MKQSHWALGSTRRRELPNGDFVGISSFSQKELIIRIKSDPKLMLVDYYTGTDSDNLRWATSTRIIPANALGKGDKDDCCVVAMTTWKAASATDAEWDAKHHLWPVEINLIKSRLEYERDHPDEA